MTAIMGGSHLKKVSENETRMYTLCTLNGKELDTGHISSPNSELSYCTVTYNYSVSPLKLHLPPSIFRRQLFKFNKVIP